MSGHRCRTGTLGASSGWRHAVTGSGQAVAVCAAHPSQAPAFVLLAWSVLNNASRSANHRKHGKIKTGCPGQGVLRQAATVPQSGQHTQSTAATGLRTGGSYTVLLKKMAKKGKQRVVVNFYCFVGGWQAALANKRSTGRGKINPERQRRRVIVSRRAEACICG